MTDPVNQGTGHQYTYQYDASGNLLSITDPLGHATTYGYDADNRLASVTDANNQTTTYIDDKNGNVVNVQDPNFHVTTYTYDGLNRLADVTDANGDTTTYTYDGNGNLISRTDGNGHTTTYTYNALDERTAVTDALNDVTTYTYDNNGNVTSVIDPLGHATTYTYDAENRVLTETDPSGGGTTTYTYDPAGNLLTLTDPVGNTTTYTYNAENQVATETSPTGGVTTYTYDLNGNVIQKVDPDGHTIQYTYDADNRETTETWVNSSGGAPLDVITMTYDRVGNLTGIQDAHSDYAYTYDPTNKLQTASNSGTPGSPTVTLTYGYDWAGNLWTRSDSLGGEVNYTYDGANRLIGEVQSGTGVDAASIGFGYDANNNITSITRYSGIESFSGGSGGSGGTEVANTLYGYDNAERLTSVTHQTASGTTIASYVYTLDAASRVTSEVHTWNDGSNTDTLAFTYTDNNQVTGVTHTDTSLPNESFSYDSNGNRTMSGYSTGTGNELSSDGTYNYTYDANGNLITKTDIASGVETIYSWDYRNRLIEVDQVSGGVRTVLATYVYDALNRRIAVTESGATTWTVYDGFSTEPLMDFNGSGTLTARYLDGPTPAGVDAVLERDTPAGGVAWYLTDRLGTVGDLIDNSGTVIDHIDYGVFGNVVSESNPANGDRLKYAGMQYDTVIQLYFDQARWYDPASGRFVSIDPSGFSATDANLYRYVGNGATNATDPTGLVGDRVLPLDENGQLMGDVPKRVDPSWDCDKLRQALKDILTSIDAREGAMEYEDMFGDGRDPGHIRRKALEEEFKNKLKDRMKKLDCDGGSNKPAPVPNPPGSKPTTTTTTTTTAVPNPNPSAPPPPPGGYPPNPNPGWPWWAFWVPADPNNDWKQDVGIGIVIVVGGAVAGPALLGGGAATGTGATTGVLVGAGSSL